MFNKNIYIYCNFHEVLSTLDFSLVLKPCIIKKSDKHGPHLAVLHLK